MKNEDIANIMINTIILFAKGDSISPEEWTLTSAKNKNKPNIKKIAEAKKQKIDNGVALPGADTVGGTLPVPI